MNVPRKSLQKACTGPGPAERVRRRGKSTALRRSRKITHSCALLESKGMVHGWNIVKNKSCVNKAQQLKYFSKVKEH